MSDEKWLPCVGFPKYEVSDAGRVRRRFDGRPISLCEQSRGYLKAGLYRGGRQSWIGVHRLVADAFVAGRSAERSQVNHIDLDKKNNRASNLEWCSQFENCSHAAANGRWCGSTNRASRLSESDVYSIKSRLACGESPYSIASDFGVGRTTIRRIQSGETWGWLGAGLLAAIDDACKP